MEIETVNDLCEYLADLVGVYGGCKHADKSTDSECPEKLITCCRIGFVTEISERIRKAVENEKLLSAMDERKYGLGQSNIPDVIKSVCRHCGCKEWHKQDDGYNCNDCGNDWRQTVL